MAKFSVKKRLTVFMAVIAVIVLGFVSYGKMTPDLLPNIDLPYVVVMTTYPGASPEKIETTVSKPLEQTLSTLDNVKNIQSISSSNVSIMIIEFNSEANMDTVGVDIQQQVNLISGFWDDAVGTPIILKLNPSMMPVAIAAVSMEGMDQEELSEFVDETLMNKLEGIDGVASVNSVGLLETKLHVVITQEKIDAINKKIMETIMMQMAAAMQNPDAADMISEDMQAEAPADANADTTEDPFAQLDMNNIITVDMITNILKAQNFAMPEGYVKQDGVSYLVSVGDEIGTLEEMQNLVLVDLGIPGVDPIYLKDVAEVTLINNADDVYAKIDGKDGIIFTFNKQSDAATAKVTDNIQDEFKKLEKEYDGLKFVTLMDQGEYIHMVIGSIIQSLLQAALFSVIVLFIFLKDWRPTVITLLSIPVSVVFAFVLMYFSGVTLNMISMSALAISVGMLVDNSVVVIENIYRLRSKGATTIQAAVNGAKQVGGAIAASTLTTICVFAPIVFVDGITRQLFTDLGLTLAYSLVASLIIAMTLVPAMASGMLKKSKPKEHKLFDKFTNGYQKVLRWSLRFKPVVVLGTIFLLVFSIWAVLRRGFIFMPEMNSPQITVNVELPIEATFDDTKEVSDEIMARIMTIEGVETVGVMSGSAGGMSLLGGEAPVNQSTFYVLLEEDTDVKSVDVGDQIIDLCADLDCVVTPSTSGMDSSSLGGSGISLYVYGNDKDELMQTCQDIAAILGEVEGIDEVESGVEDTDPEIHISVKKDVAIREGLTVAQVYMAINEAMNNETEAGSVTFDGYEYDCVVVDKNEAAKTPDDIKNMVITVTGIDGNPKQIKVSDIADIEEKDSLSSINRRNQKRYINITATVKEGYNVTKVNDLVEEKIDSMDIPRGISVEFSGESETIMESMRQLILMLLLGLLLVYMIMVAQFQSFKSPFIIMFTIPLAFTGGFLALFLTGQELSIISMLGFVMLCGIIVNNGIVLVDFINQLRRDGMDKKEAIVEAGVTRMRPILMTSITTILGLAVMVLGIGGTEQGSEMMQPLVIVCIGGLVYATLLTLLLVPVLYDIMNGNKMRVVKDEDIVFEEEE